MTKIKECPICGSTHTGLNRLPDGSFVLHCDESCGAIWETKTEHPMNLFKEESEK